MNFLILPIICLQIVYIIGEECIPGKITGISCLRPKDIIEQYQPIISELRGKITMLHRTTGERLASTKNLILQNIADAQNITQMKIQITRNQLAEAKVEAKYSTLKVQTCIEIQNLELGKIMPNPMQSCTMNENFNALTLVRAKIFKLQNILNGIGMHCGFLNPLRNDHTSLKLCIESKLKDLDLRLIDVGLEFEKSLQEIINLSTKCIVRETGNVFVHIGRVLGAVRSCKNILCRDKVGVVDAPVELSDLS